MKEFIKKYAEDPSMAKNAYYSEKLKFDMKSDKGSNDKTRMLKKYLEGL